MLEQAPAFRDIGGLTTREGRHVVRGRLFRSDALEHLNPADQDSFRALGIRTVCDLRSEGERRRHPNRLPSGHVGEMLHFGILTDVRAGDARLFEPLRRRPDVQGASEMMLAMYRALPAAFVPHLGALLRRIGAGGLPMVIHCTAGKDRTGFAVAMVLSVLGVARSDIVQEYLLTNRTSPSARRMAYVHDLLALHLGFRPHASMVEPLLQACAAYLEASFETLDRTFGSVEGYLRQACGLDEATLVAVREALLTD